MGWSQKSTVWVENQDHPAGALGGQDHSQGEALGLLVMCVTSSATVRRKSTTRGPHSEAMGSAMGKTCPSRTAFMTD
jgi:hypothetical protein